jgi:hypothetical protein
MKQFDLLYQCHVTGQESTIWQLQCHLRIFELFGQQIVIISPQNCEIGWFFPAQIEKLATQIVQDFELDPERLTWVEQDLNYRDRQIGAEYSVIQFQWHQGVATKPEWKVISDNFMESSVSETFFYDKISLNTLAAIFH